jgi:hypothetical protein
MAQLKSVRMNKTNAKINFIHTQRDGQQIDVCLTVEKNDVPFVKKLAEENNLMYDIWNDHFYSNIGGRHLEANRLIAKRNIKIPNDKNIRWLDRNRNNVVTNNIAV